jgi:hypothetical protein
MVFTLDHDTPARPQHQTAAGATARPSSPRPSTRRRIGWLIQEQQVACTACAERRTQEVSVIYEVSAENSPAYRHINFGCYERRRASGEDLTLERQLAIPAVLFIAASCRVRWRPGNGRDRRAARGRHCAQNADRSVCGRSASRTFCADRGARCEHQLDLLKIIRKADRADWRPRLAWQANEHTQPTWQRCINRV